MDQKFGQENMAVVKRWPLVEVRLYNDAKLILDENKHSIITR